MPLVGELPLRFKLGLAALIAAGAVGCGIDDAPVAVPFREPARTLLETRNFSQGDVEIEEQVFRTEADRFQDFEVRARITNLGAPIEAARYEVTLERILERPDGPQSLNGGLRPGVPLTEDSFEFGPARVEGAQELGRLHSSQTTVASVRVREFSPVRTRVRGRLADANGVVN